MLYRETLSLILYNVQANRKGAIDLEESTLVDPRLTSLKPISSSSRASSLSRASPAPLKTLYNRSRKRNIVEIANNKDNTTNSLNKKVNLRVTITSLSKEIARN